MSAPAVLVEFYAARGTKPLVTYYVQVGSELSLSEGIDLRWMQEVRRIKVYAPPPTDEGLAWVNHETGERIPVTPGEGECPGRPGNPIAGVRHAWRRAGSGYTCTRCLAVR
jgi:hypothetical protein